MISNFLLLREARKILYRPIYQYFYFTNTESLTESYKSKLNSIMKPFYSISNMNIEHEKLFQLIHGHLKVAEEFLPQIDDAVFL